MNRNEKGFLKLGFLAAACILASAPAYASLVFSLQPVAAIAGDTGDTFDVLLTNPDPGPVSIAGFNFTIESSDPTDITFTGVFTSTTTAAYIFAGNSLLGPEIDDQLTPTVIAADVASTGSTTLNSGDVFGLGQVVFDVSPTAAPGPITISFVTTGGTADNDLSDPSGDDVPIGSFSDGGITIGSNVPEPSSFLLTLGGAGVLAAWTRRRNASQRPS